MFKRELFEDREQMAHCIMLKKIGLSISYELYDEATNKFLMACVSCPIMSPLLLFVTLQDCHKKRFEDLCCNLHVKYFIAKMIPDWKTSMRFEVFGFEGAMICEISAPVAFTVDIYDYDRDDYISDSTNSKPVNQSCTKEVTTRNPSQDTLFDFNFINCFQDQDMNCLSTSSTVSFPMIPKQNSITKASSPSKLMYTSISQSTQDQQVIHLISKQAEWNTELKQYLHYFSGRVKQISPLNFIALQTLDDENQQEKYFQQALPLSIGDRMCIRHGKISHDQYILDFRSPVSPLIAFSIACAIHN